MSEATPRGCSDRRLRRANDLDGRTWCRYSVSVWSDLRKTPEEMELGHPALFPEALPARLIECFTRAEDNGLVLDPFAGMGSTLIAAARLGRRAVGIELSPEYVEAALKRFDRLGISKDLVMLHHADAREASRLVPQASASLVVTSPPYWDVLKQRRTADGKAIRDYTCGDGDLGSICDYGCFLAELGRVFGSVKQTIRPGGYCCIIVMDIRKGSRFYPLHSDLAQVMQGLGYLYDDLIVWDRRQEYNHFRPLGYPSVFRVNKAHEFILIFKTSE
ncbi:MAG: DNA methyltransferase [Armatimonadota bacterium]